MAETRKQRALVWLDPDQTGLVSRALAVAGVEVVAAGSALVGRATEVAGGLGAVEPVNDLRAALTRMEVDVVLLAAPGDFASGSNDADDLQALAACRERGAKVVSLEPLPGSLLQFDALAASGEGKSQWAAFCPLASGSGVFRGVGEVLEQVGQPLTMAVECWSGPGQGSLGSRLFDAMDLIVRLIGDPEQVDAAYAWPKRGGAIHAAPGESLHGLTGHLTVNLRFAEGRSATIAASDHAGRWCRAVTIVGEGGRLAVDDGGFTWFAPDGREVDSSRRGVRDAGDATEFAAAVIADNLSRLLDGAGGPGGRGGGSSPTDSSRVLAAAGAALLSARTGENESPATILRMVRAG